MKSIKRIFLDVNVLLDVLLEREEFYYDSARIWAACEQGMVDGYISAIALNNVHYIVRKLKSETTAIFNYVQDYVDGRISREAFWALAKFKHPTHQISFHTQNALKTLTFEEYKAYDM